MSASSHSPAARAKSEREEQIEVVAYLRSKYPDVIVTATGAGMGFSGKWQQLLSRLGYHRGTPDLMIFEPRGGHHGLFIEMKAVRGSLSDVQKHTLDKLTEKGYKTCVCFGAGQAIGVVDKYMSDSHGN